MLQCSEANSYSLKPVKCYVKFILDCRSLTSCMEYFSLVIFYMLFTKVPYIF